MNLRPPLSLTAGRLARGATALKQSPRHHPSREKLTLLLAFTACALAAALRAELKLPAIIGDHMVLQQKQANPIWG
jgi:hypothetical protein